MIADKQKSPHKKGYLAALQGVAKQRALTFTRRGFPMKDFRRDNLLFSLCGLNCSLCPMNLNQHCPGCGGGEGNQSCSLAKCSLQHENVEYCFQCKHYPCEKYDNIDAFDSFITHQHQKQDMENFMELGMDLYTAKQQRKKVLLDHLLTDYNDGRKKTLFCVAVNLLELDDLENVLSELDESTSNLTLKEKSAHAAALLLEAADRKHIVLKLRKRKKLRECD